MEDIFKIMIIKAAIKYSKVGMCVCYYYVVYRNDSLVEDMMNSMKSFFLIFLLLTVTILGLIFSLSKNVIWRLNLTIIMYYFDYIFFTSSLQSSYWSQYSVITLSPSILLKWRLEEGEDSLQKTTNNLTDSIQEDSTTPAPPAPDYNGTWDRTLSWDNSLTQLKLLKSIGTGNPEWLRQRSTNM